MARVSPDENFPVTMLEMAQAAIKLLGKPSSLHRNWRLRSLALLAQSGTSNVPYAPNVDGPRPMFTIERDRNCYYRISGNPKFQSCWLVWRRRNLDVRMEGRRPGYTLKNGHFQSDTKVDRYSSSCKSKNSSVNGPCRKQSFEYALRAESLRQ